MASFNESFDDLAILNDSITETYESDLTVKVLEACDVPCFAAKSDVPTNKGATAASGAATTAGNSRRNSITRELSDLSAYMFSSPQQLQQICPFISVGVAKTSYDDDIYSLLDNRSGDDNESSSRCGSYDLPDSVKSTTVKTHHFSDGNSQEKKPSWYSLMYDQTTKSKSIKSSISKAANANADTNVNANTDTNSTVSKFENPPTPRITQSATTTTTIKWHESLTFESIPPSSTILLNLNGKIVDQNSIASRALESRQLQRARDAAKKSSMNYHRTALGKTRGGKIHKRRDTLQSSVIAAAAAVATFLADLDTDENSADGKKSNSPTADEIAIGQLVIPLSRLPENQVVRQWYTIVEPPADGHNDSNRLKYCLPGKNSRMPSIHLEITLTRGESSHAMLSSSPRRTPTSETPPESLRSSSSTPTGKGTLGEIDTKLPPSPTVTAIPVRFSSPRRDKSPPRPPPHDESDLTERNTEKSLLMNGIADSYNIVSVRYMNLKKSYGEGADGEEEAKAEERTSDPGTYVVIPSGFNLGWLNTIKAQTDVILSYPPSFGTFKGNNRRKSSGVDNVLKQLHWFCFPRGPSLWLGPSPPTEKDFDSENGKSCDLVVLDDGSIAVFEWFFLTSHGDSFGEASQKSYIACLKVFEPVGDERHNTDEDHTHNIDQDSCRNLLFLPVCHTLVSAYPIIGTLKHCLIRIANGIKAKKQVAQSIRDLVFRLPCGVPNSSGGSTVVNTSFPFLGSHLPVHHCKCDLPTLPHGGSVQQTVSLLGKKGFNLLLAAMLTESKILLVSDGENNASMIIETMNALIYPFVFTFPIIPKLSERMLDFIEAPLPFILGVTPSLLKRIEPNVLDDVVVYDVDGSELINSGVMVALPNAIAENIGSSIATLRRGCQGDVNGDETSCSNVDGLCQAGAGESESESESESDGLLEEETSSERKFRVEIFVQLCLLVKMGERLINRNNNNANSNNANSKNNSNTNSEANSNSNSNAQNSPLVSSNNTPTLTPSQSTDSLKSLNSAAAQAFATAALSTSHVPTPLQNLDSNDPPLINGEEMNSPKSLRMCASFLRTQLFQTFMEAIDSDRAALFHDVLDLIEVKEGQHFSSYNDNTIVQSTMKILQKKEKLATTVILPDNPLALENNANSSENPKSIFLVKGVNEENADEVEFVDIFSELMSSG